MQRVERAGSGFLVNGERFDRVVNTMPLQRLIEVVPALPDQGRGPKDVSEEGLGEPEDGGS